MNTTTGQPTEMPIETGSAHRSNEPHEGTRADEAASPTTRAGVPSLTTPNAVPMEVLPVGSVHAAFHAEVIKLPPQTPNTAAVAESGSDCSDDDAMDGHNADTPTRGAHHRGGLGSVVDLMAMLLRVVASELIGGRVVGTSMTRIGVVWRVQDVRRAADDGEAQPGATACRVIRETLQRICGDLVEGDGDWIRCNGDDALRLRVAVVVATPSKPLVVVQAADTAAATGSGHSNASFLLHPACLPNATLARWLPWTVDEVVPHCSGDGGALSPTVFPSGNASPIESFARQSAFPTDDDGPSPPSSPAGLSRVPSRAFSVDDLGAAFAHCTHRLSRTPLRSESDAASSVVVVRLACSRNALVQHQVPLTARAQGLAALRSEIASKVHSVAAQFRGCVLSTSLFDDVEAAPEDNDHGTKTPDHHGAAFAAQPSTTSQESQPACAAEGAVVVVEVVVALPRVELTWRMGRYTEHCAEAAVTLVDAVVSAFYAWMGRWGQEHAAWCAAVDPSGGGTDIGCPAVPPTLHNLSTTGSGATDRVAAVPRLALFAGGCLLQGHVLQSAVVAGARHRRPQVIVGGEVLHRATALLREAQLDAQGALGDSSGTSPAQSSPSTPPASGTAPHHLIHLDGAAAFACICEPSIAHWLAHNSNSMELRQPPHARNRGHGGIAAEPHAPPYVCLVPHQPHPLWTGHRLDRLALQLTQRKLNSAGVRHLVGVDDARRQIGQFLAVHRMYGRQQPSDPDSGLQGMHTDPCQLPSTASAAALHVCLITGPPHSGKTTLLLDCAIHLALLPTCVLVDGHGCRPLGLSWHGPSADAGRGRHPHELDSPEATAASDTASGPGGVAAATTAPLLLRVYTHLVLARRQSEDAVAAGTLRSHTLGGSVANGSTPRTLSALVDACLQVMRVMRTAGELLVLLVDDLDHVEGDQYSLPLLHRLSVSTQLTVLMVSTSLSATPDVLRGVLDRSGDAWSMALPFPSATAAGGVTPSGVCTQSECNAGTAVPPAPAPLTPQLQAVTAGGLPEVIRVALYDTLQGCSTATATVGTDSTAIATTCSEGTLLSVFQVLQQFVGTSLLREAVESLHPTTTRYNHHDDAASASAPFCSGLRRLLRGIAVVSGGSLTAIASIACHLKDRTQLLSMCQCLVHADADLCDVDSSVDSRDALLAARLDDLLAADHCHFFHNTLSEWLAVLSPMDATWVCAVACYCAALGSHCRSFPVAVGEALFGAVCLTEGIDDRLSDDVVVTDNDETSATSMFASDVLAKLAAPNTPVNGTEDEEAPPPAPPRPGADDAILRLLVRFDQPSNTLRLTSMFVPRIVLRLMRHDVVVRCCDCITVCTLYDSMPVSAKLWLACSVGLVEDRALMGRVAAVLATNDDAAPDVAAQSACSGTSGSIVECRRVCHVLRRFGYPSKTMDPAVCTAAAGAVANPPHKRVRAAEVAEVATSSAAYDRLLTAIDATERGKKRIRRAGLARGACSSIVMVPTRCPDVDTCLDYLRNAWRLLDTVLLKVRREHQQHVAQQEHHDGCHHAPPTATMTSPHPFAGGGMGPHRMSAMFTDLSFASVLSTESAPTGVGCAGDVAHAATAEGDAVLLGCAVNCCALSLREALFVAEQRLRATWKLCKTVVGPIEAHDDAAAPLPPSVVAMRAAMANMERLMDQALGDPQENSVADNTGMDVGLYRTPYQELCTAVAERYKEVALAARTLAPKDTRSIKERLLANVRCTALQSGLLGLHGLLERLHNDRRSLDDAEDITKYVRAQTLQEHAARCIHDALGVATVFIVRVLSAASCVQCSSCKTAAPQQRPVDGSGLVPTAAASEGSGGTATVHGQQHHHHHAQLAIRNKHNSAAHAVMERRIRRRFLIDVAHRYLTSLSALGEHVRTNRSALASDIMELLAALVTVFPTATMGYVTELCVVNAGDLRRENLLHAEVVVAPPREPHSVVGARLPVADDPTAATAEASVWSIAVQRVAPMADVLPPKPAAAWKPKPRARALPPPPPPS